MEEERSSTSREDSHSASYSPDHSTHDSRNPNSEEEEEEEEDVHKTKRRKYVAVSGDSDDEDRITGLSDSILVRILSCLPTKDAIKTGVLSKRWAHLWTSVPSLSFSHHCDFTNKVFASDVDETLLLHRAPKLSKFSVEFWYNSQLKPRLDVWVRFATVAKVDQLCLKLSSSPYENSEAYVLPQHLYVNEFVSELDFSSCKIIPTGIVTWSSLKRLCIGDAALNEETMRKVLMGSPRLELLELHNCYQIKQLDIVSDSLRKLVIRDYCKSWFRREWNLGKDMEIVAPKIESLEILGIFNGKKCRVKDVSALVEAKLDLCLSTDDEYFEEEVWEPYQKYQDIVRGLLESMHHVKELTVGSSCLRALSIMSVKDLPSLLSNCKCLVMKTYMEKLDLPGMASLLQSSPYVETLVIDIISPYYSEFEYLERRYLNSCKCDEVSHGKSKEAYFKSLLVCLKTIKIFGFEERSLHIKEVFILLVQFLLKNAKVLEKMVISEPRIIQNHTCNMLLLHEFLRVAQKLLSFPRSSPHAMVMFPSLVKSF